ncbi:MAG: hypothetical protein M0T77_05305 [Actinomycetota bacterium]|nr:hypothetical protein [Actinomycetota bacterium]
MSTWLAGATESAEVRPQQLLEHVAVKVVLDANLLARMRGLAVVDAGSVGLSTLYTLCRLTVPSTTVLPLGFTAAVTASDTAAHNARPPAEPAIPRDDPTTMRLAAERSVVRAPAVSVELPDVPKMTGDPLDDVRALYGLTYADLASLLGVTERQAHRLDAERLSPERRELLEALVAVGLIIIGGLGPDGAWRWLETGSPPGIQLLHESRYSELRARAERLRDSVAT